MRDIISKNGVGDKTMKIHSERVALAERIAKAEDNRDKATIDRDMFVVKSNTMIQKSRFALNLQEQRIVLYIISKIKPDDTELLNQSFSIKEFCDICGINSSNSSNVYNYIKKTIKSIADKSMWIEIEKGQIILVRWIDKPKINPGKGTIDIRLDKDLMPYLIQVKKHYTQYPLLNVIAMKCKYSVRLYELLKSYANLGSKTFEVEELKKRLNAENYVNFSNFRVKVLEPSLAEIKLYSDLDIGYVLRRNGRKVERIDFIITPISDLQERMKKWANVGDKLNKEEYRALYGKSYGEE